MVFTEFRFLPFFLTTLAVHWLLRGQTIRKAWLLACSYAFYAAWDWRFLSLILASTWVDFAVGRGLARASEQRHRRWLLGASLTVNLGMLGYFKYRGFFVESTARFLDTLGLPVAEPTLELVLPLGISFYTFQTLSYAIDVYRKRIEPVRSLLDMSLFVAFFPQLLAGPIVRARSFLPQLDSPRRWAGIDVRLCLLLILIGYVKKACLSDNISPVVDRYFANPSSYTSLSTWIGLTLFAAQLYCDFSGYSNLARGCAGLLGYDVGINFNFPLFAPNIASLWNRWHISLTDWVMDYIFYPLERGNRPRSPWITGLNAWLTMSLIGLWHGPRAGFVLWGMLHGLALIAYWGWRGVELPPGLRRLTGLVGTLTVFPWCVLTLALFRAEDLGTAWAIVACALGLTDGFVVEIDVGWIGLLGALVAIHYVSYTGWPWRLLKAAPTWLFAVTCGVWAALALAFARSDARPFIYFDF